MNYSIIAIITVALLAVVGCSVISGKRAAITASHVVALEDAYEDVGAIYQANIDKVPEAKRGPVKDAWATLQTIRTRVEDAGAKDIAKNAGRVEDLYNRARRAYMTMRPVAQDLIEQGKISGADAAKLKELDRRAKELDETLGDLTGNDRIAAALGFARDVVPILGKIIVAAI